MSDALGLALAALPIEVDVDTILTGAQVEIDALHEAGLTETAAWTTTAIDDFFTQTVGAFGAAFPANGPLDADESEQLANEMVGSMAAACSKLVGSIDVVTDELLDTAGTDTVSPIPELVAAFGEYEVDLRRWMHNQEAEDGNLSSQAVANRAIHEFQKSRMQASTNQSLSQCAEGLKAAMNVLASTYSASTTGRTTARHTIPARPLWRAHMTSPPPPDEITDFCEVFTAITFVVELTLSCKGLIRAADTAAAAATQRFVDFIDEVDEVGDEAQYLFNRYKRWVITDVGEEAKNQIVSDIQGRVRGAVEGELSEVDCDFLAAILVTCFFILSVVTWFLSFIKSITWVSGLLGATTSGGMIALLVIILLVVVIYFVLQMVCSVVSTLSTLEDMFKDCTP